MTGKALHQASEADLAWRDDFEAYRVAPADFRHRQHIRLAYIYLVTSDPETACVRMKAAITNLLAHLGVDPAAKYHETVTRAWILAVHHFMHSDPVPAESADAFIDANPRLLMQDIMLTHYSREHLFSDTARYSFVAPDRMPIPLHA
ncbi:MULTISPECIES: hypothetical protein [unclassified Minwuia]|jgi:hypothetical protein|uniref:hypothetical protein n=1 Tax=unclassified Minwuia TaxID=2618799 RepID=UPI002479FAAA|nr:MULTISPECIES: hypothetical protein [unclassified Minwuia]